MKVLSLTYDRSLRTAGYYDQWIECFKNLSVPNAVLTYRCNTENLIAGAYRKAVLHKKIIPSIF